MFYGRKWTDVSIEKFMTLINEYIIWYNIERIKQLLGYSSTKSIDDYWILIKIINLINCSHPYILI